MASQCRTSVIFIVKALQENSITSESLYGTISFSPTVTVFRVVRASNSISSLTWSRWWEKTWNQFSFHGRWKTNPSLNIIAKMFVLTAESWIITENLACSKEIMTLSIHVAFYLSGCFIACVQSDSLKKCLYKSTVATFTVLKAVFSLSVHTVPQTCC